MTEEELVAAILAAPDDDEPRLVYADWLTDRGDPRGEFIELSCRQAQHAYYSEPYQTMLARVHELEAANREAWCAPFAGAGEVLFTRGLPSYLSLDADVFVEKMASFVALAPIRQFMITALDDERMFALAGSPSLAHVTHAYLHGSPTARGLAALASSEHLRDDVGLVFAFGLGVAGAVALAGGARADRLSWIGVQGVGDDGVAALARMPRLRGLTASGERLSLRAAEALAAGRSLVQLMLPNNPLGDEGVALLAGLPAISRLFLGSTGMTAAGTRELAARLPASMHTLGLGQNHLGDEGARAIAGAPQLGGLVELYLDWIDLGAAGLEAILASPHLRSLELLSIDGAPDGPLAALDDPAVLPSLLIVRFEHGRDLGPLLARSRSLKPGPWPDSLWRVRA
jgi:uncharacterized protein (TIGR02996 family)